MTHVVAFVHLLRSTGIKVSSEQTIDLARALEHVPIVARGDFRAAARCTLICRREDLPVFDAAFDFYWRMQSGFDPLMLAIPVVKMPPKPLRLPRRPRSQGDGHNEPDRHEEQQEEKVGFTLTFTAAETLRTKDFGNFSYEEIGRAHV